MNTTNKHPEESSALIHVVIVRRVRAGCEAEFQTALREFFQTSFSHGGVMGASMIVPPPGSRSPEYGILRTFSSEKERDSFYDSPLFAAWEERIAPLTEGGWSYRQLHGLEAWFRSSNSAPPRWKMALLTLIAVWPVSMAVHFMLSPIASHIPNYFINAGLAAAGIVATLTWLAMPLLVKLARNWLRPPIHPLLGDAKTHPKWGD